MKDTIITFLIVVGGPALFIGIMCWSYENDMSRKRNEVINELCQKQQYDFCKVKEVIYMENNNE